MNFLNDIFMEQIDRFSKEIGRDVTAEEVEEIVKNVIPEASEILMKDLEKDTPAMLRFQYEKEREFRAQTMQMWGEGFDLLVGYGVMCQEIGEFALKESCPKPSYPELVKFEAISRQHARACLIYKEVLCLLMGGFADGALARWRSLHEIAVVSMLLSESEPDLSKRFLDYQGVEAFKRLRVYQRSTERLNLEPFDEEEVKEMTEEYERIIDKYGKEFSDQYGWTKQIINKKKVYLSDIEQLVNIEHLRPYYKWACEKNHSSANALYRPLGLYIRDDRLLAGPSSYGFADPAQLSAISLGQATSALLPICANMDLIIAFSVCQKTLTKICDVVVNIQSEIENSADERNNNN